MCILKEVGRFIKNGASTFRDASQGHYKQNSEAISEIRKEILEKDRNRNDDKRNLMEDRKKELLKKIATEFPALKESEKYYIAGYISHAEDTRAEKMKVQTA